jgi:hypothetical protein
MPPHRLVLDKLAAVSPRRQPYMVRANYVHEVRSALTFPLAAALAEGTFTGVVASKYFDASLLLIAVITAAPMFGNILALLWSELAEDRPKVKFINTLQLGVVIAMAAVGLTYFIPTDPMTLAGGAVAFDEGQLAGWAFAGLIIVARVLASGIITLRSAVWRLNYPRALRAQIIGRINGIYNTMLSATVLVSAILLDSHPGLYAVIYPVIAAVSLVGVLQFSRIKVRGEAGLLRRARLVPTAASVDAEGGATPDYARVTRDLSPRGPLARLGRRIVDAFGLLKSDKMFREYQWWQFLLGASFMMMFPSLIYMVSSEMTDPTTQYVLAVVVLQFVPMVTGVVFLQVWAPVFDRVSIFRFRVLLGFAALSAHVLILVGALLNSLPVVAIGTFAVGVSMGGGQLAWQLGQNAFATRENVGTYMGLHVMLTGMRGMFAPFLGVGIYHVLSGWVDAPGGMPGGRWVFLVPASLCLISMFGYARMSRRYADFAREQDQESEASDKGRAGQGPITGAGPTSVRSQPCSTPS